MLMHGAKEPLGVTSGLVLYLDAANARSYPKSGTTWFDRSGNGNNGTLVNGVGYNGSNYGSLSFDGVDDYVTAGKNFVGTITTFTVNHFIYLNANQISRTIFSNYNSTNNQGWVTGISDSTNNVIKFYLGSTTLYSTTALTAGIWYCVTVTYDNGNPKIYINGILNASSANTLVISTPLDDNYIGRVVNVQYFNGRISNLQAYNRALSASEIKQNYDALKGRYGLT